MKIPEPRKLKSGKWFIQLRLNGVSVPITGDTPKECKDAAALIKAEHRAGVREIKAQEAKPTLSKAIDAYIKKRENTLSPSTIDGYRRIQKNRFQEVMNTPLADIKDWQGICDREAKVCSPKTLRNAYRFITSVLTENGILAKKITLPALENNTRQWLEPDQITKLIEYADNTPSALPVYLALHSLRRSEILALDWANIDLKNDRINVRGAVVQNEKHEFVKRKANKTKTSTRSIPIMIPELQVILASTPKDSRKGPVLNVAPHTIADQINAACERAGLPKVGTHGLRHSFASLAYHLGMSELETMEIGGWADTQTMHKIYTHLASADRLKAENKMAQFFKNANKNANGDKKGTENTK